MSEKYLLYSKAKQALDMEIARFQANPDHTTYRSVRAAALATVQPEDLWPGLRPQLIQTLEQQGRWGALVRLYLDEKEVSVDQLIEQENFFQQGLVFMESGKREEAGQAFQASIAMGDCLPQPWGNLGICLMIQERYDEAEVALKRALEIDPEYTIAKNNLVVLRTSRRTGPPALVELNEPFKNSKLNQSITFIKE